MKSIYRNSKEEDIINGLKSLEVNPPKGLWDDIESTLAEKQKRKIFIITSWASAATIALLFSIGGFYYLNKNGEVLKANDLITKEEPTQLIETIEPEKPIEKVLSQNTETRSIVVSQNNEESASFAIINEKTLATVDSVRCDDIPSVVKSINSSINKTIATRHEALNLQNGLLNNGLANAIASIDPSTQKRNGEWFFSASGFPVYSFHTAGAMNKNTVNQESGIVSWGGAASVRYSYSNGISIESGLTYNILGQQEKNIFLVASDLSNAELSNTSNLSNSFGMLTIPNANIRVMGTEGLYNLSTNAINASSLDKIDALQRFRYLEIPLLIAKGYSIKGIKLNFKAGVAAGFLIGNRLDITGNNLSLRGKTQGVNTFVSSAITSVGLLFPISNRTNLLIEPTFKLGLNTLSSANHKSYPFSTFIKFGIEIPF